MATFNGTTGADILPPLATGAADAAGNDTIVGLAGDDTLAGWAGDDLLNGGAGADTLIGGTISVDGTTGTTAPAGADTASYAGSPAGVSIDLGAVGSYTRVAGGITLTLTNTSVGQGGDAEGDYLTGITHLIGSAFDDRLIGNSLANFLQGGAGNDRLVGVRGADTMAGGTGDDLYGVDNLGDIVTELVDEGHDGVVASVDYTLGDNIEDLTLSGRAIHGTGNDLANRIDGNGQNNVIDGAAGADILVGGLGADAIAGGAGDDIYSVDNAGDTVTELPGEGRDRINASISLVLPDNVEILNLTGGAYWVRGNNLGNVISCNDGGNLVYAGEGNDLVVARGGDDTIYGYGGNDRLYGDDGNDYLGGVGGNDDLWGGNGNDALAGQNGDDRLFGGDGADKLVGGEDNDYLLGGAGFDRLGGFTGADTFAFEVLGIGADRILDFEDGIDHIELNRAGFSMAPGEVEVVNAASSAGIVGDALFYQYQTTTGSLFWHDGETGTDTLFAFLDNPPAALDINDFVLV